MKSSLTLFFSLCLLASCSQPSRFNNALKVKLHNEKHPAMQYTLLVKGNIAKLNSDQSVYGHKLNYFAGDIASVTCNINSLSRLVEDRVISYAEYIEPGNRPMNDSMIHRNRIKAVKHWTSNLPRAYDGDGVVLGFIDSGVDFNHPDLKDSLGKTRVKFLWDQNNVSGPPAPAPFNYGVEWTAAQMDANLCTHTDYAHFGHGTHVAGIAAGNGLANHTNEGCAPKTDIVYVALGFNQPGPTIADAVQYILSKAALLGKPCVINASVGDYYGSHDGTNLEAKLIDNMVSNIPGRVMVASAGNAGSYKFHVKTEPQGTDTMFSWLANPFGCDYWCYGDTNQMKSLQIAVGANRGNYSNLGTAPFRNFNYSLSSVKHDTLFHNGHRIGVIRSSASINSYGVCELYLHIDQDSSGLLWRIETKGNGLHHAWNFDFVSSGLPSVSQFPKMNKYLVADSLYSMVSSFQCSDEIITVANYNNVYQYYDMRDTLHYVTTGGGHISYDSSLGPTRDGRIKPDIAASGDYIYSCMALGLQSAYIANHPEQVAKGLMHVIGGGTSAASPVVAGLAALYLQRFPYATNRQVRDAIRFCAYQDGFTGSNLPNYQWGFGKLDGKAAMTCGENFSTGIYKNREPGPAICFPNPFREEVSIDPGVSSAYDIMIYDPLGKILFQKNKVEGPLHVFSADLPDGYTGILFLKLNYENDTKVYKLIKE